jgi:hypothetical protein
LATCFDPAGSSSGLYVNQVMFKTPYICGIPGTDDDPAGSKRVASSTITNK